MDVISTYRYARISPYKARKITRELQGLAVSQALDIVTFIPQKAAVLVGKTLRSAIANAENNHELDADSLVVKECVVGDGPSFRRFKARARGSAAPIRRHTSHIRVVLTDEGGTAESKQAKAKKAAAKKPEAKKPEPEKAEVKKSDGEKPKAKKEATKKAKAKKSAAKKVAAKKIPADKTVTDEVKKPEVESEDNA